MYLQSDYILNTAMLGASYSFNMSPLYRAENVNWQTFKQICLGTIFISTWCFTNDLEIANIENV